MHKFLSRSGRKLIPFFAIFALLSLLLTSITYAQDEFKNPVLEAVSEAGFITKIGATKTIGDATVTVDWAYADTQNLMVGYTLKTTNGMKASDLLSSYNSPYLIDDSGAMFSYSNIEPDTGDQSDTMTIIVNYYPQAVRPIKGNDNFDILNDYFNPVPDKINLTFSLTLGDMQPSQDGMPLPKGSLKPANYIEPIGPFNFDFTIPVYPPVVVKQAQTIQVKGLSMTLQQVIVTPTKTTAMICFKLPDSQDWIPEGTVNIGNNAGYLAGGAPVDGKVAPAKGINRCSNLVFNIFHDTKPAALTVNIDHVATSMGEGPDDWNKIKGELAKHNIKIDVISASHSLDVKVLSVPEGVDYDRAVIEAREALGNWLQGPWTFKVDLP
ncbi:MAG: DUF4179 domain-containing protein [Chloroflexota bacterium]